MKVKDIASLIEAKYPIDSAIEEDRDKIGFELTFNKERDIDRVIVTLDVTPKIIEYAIDNGIMMIITHHPLFYMGIEEEIKNSKLKQEMLTSLSQNKIELYAAHTNTDVGEEGLSYVILKKLGIKPISFIDEETKMGAIGYLETRRNLSAIISHLVNTFDLEHLKFWDFKNGDYQRVAFVSGAGSSYISKAKSHNAEVFITSDIPWHAMIQITTLELPTIEVTHSIENVFIEVIEKVLHNEKLNIVKFLVPDKSVVYSK